MQIFRLEDGTVSFWASDLPPALPVPQAPTPLDTTTLVEAMKVHRLNRTGKGGLYQNRHLLPEPFNTMARDRLERLVSTGPKNPTMRKVKLHINAAQRMLDELRGACGCPALGR